MEATALGRFTGRWLIHVRLAVHLLTAFLIFAALIWVAIDFGVLDLQWTSPVDPDAWRETAEAAAARLGVRIGQLGGPPAESRSEKLLRHATALTTAATGPMALATSFEPCANAIAHAVITISTPKTFSTVAKWKSRSASGSTWIRPMKYLPMSAITTPMPAASR